MSGGSPLVFITQSGRHDFTPAAKFGRLEALLHGEINSFDDPQNKAMLEQAFDKLTEYVPGRDYLLLSGSPLTIAWICLLVSELEQGPSVHKFLKWDAWAGQYNVIEVRTPIAPRFLNS